MFPLRQHILLKPNIELASYSLVVEFAKIGLGIGYVTKDYIKIKYKDDDILYIPTSNLDNIRKYIGVGDKAPKVNRLR